MTDITLTIRGRVFILISASLTALGFIISKPISFVEGIPLELGGSWFIMVTGLGGLLLTYGFRLTLLIQATAIDTLIIKRQYSEEVIEDDQIIVTLEIANPTNISIYNVEIRDEYPKTTRLIRGTNHVIINIPAKGEIKISYYLKTRMIGKHLFGNIIFALRDLLGLFYFKVIKELNNEIRIYPKSYEPSGFSSVFPGSKTLTGTSYSRKKGSGYEFADLREYAPGDDLRRIDWKSSAKHRKLFIKEFDAEGIATIVIVLDASGTMSYGVLGERKLDYAARTVAYLTRYLSRRRDYVGFIYYDGIRSEMIPVTSADIVSPIIYKLLGNLEISNVIDKSGLSKLLLDSLIKLGIKEKALYILISDLEGNIGDLPNALSKIRAMRNEVVIISPSTPLFEVPALRGWDATIYRVITVDYWTERDKMIKSLLTKGIPVIDVGPKDFIPAVIKKIEDYRRTIV